MFYTRAHARVFLCPHLIGNITKVFYPVERTDRYLYSKAFTGCSIGAGSLVNSIFMIL